MHDEMHTFGNHDFNTKKAACFLQLTAFCFVERMRLELITSTLPVSRSSQMS